MALYYTCPNCGSNLDPGETCDCQRVESKQKRLTPQERVKAAVYATGNRWAQENFEAVH